MGNKKIRGDKERNANLALKANKHKPFAFVEPQRLSFPSNCSYAI
jgi:hypothetical protein